MDAKELFQEGQLFLMRGRHAESIEAFTKALAAGAPKTIGYLSRGVARFKNDDLDGAVEDFTLAIGSEPGNARAFYFRGIAYMNKNELPAAVADFDRALELDPENGAAFFARGTCHAQLGNDDDAARDMKTAISFSEVASTEMAETIGLIRTHFDLATGIMSGDRRASSVELTEEEQATLRRWLQE